MSNKSHIKSSELVSNGVEVTYSENKLTVNGIHQMKNLLKKKKINIKILQEAASISSSNMFK